MIDVVPTTARHTQPADLPDPDLTPNAVKVLERRYLARDGDGALTETPGGRYWNVAHELARGSARYVDSRAAEATRTFVARDYYRLMAEGRFLPNSPALMNAGKENGLQYSACYVLPIEDSLDAIFDTVKRAALVHQSGGGTGFGFSRLRPAGDPVRTTGGVASGPVSFLEVFNAATDAVKQGGTRRGANMGILRIDHPDVLAWINCKRRLTDDQQAAYDLACAHITDEAARAQLLRLMRERRISNFNISVAITDAFMDALAQAETYALIHPRTGAEVGRLSAGFVWRELCEAAHETGDPGMVFIDRANASASNPCPSIETLEATNPCGEQFLSANDVCNLGSLNLARFVCAGGEGVRPDLDVPALERATRLAVRLLDDVIEVNPYPDALIDAKAHANRRLGLGVMGWAELLFELGIPYDSEDAVELGGRVMALVNAWAHDESSRLADERGAFPNFIHSRYLGGPALRNATLTTVAPTGTISIIAGCSSGIEPLFALAFDRQGSLDGELAIETNALFEAVARREGFWDASIAAYVARTGSVQGCPSVPDVWQRVFVTSHEIAPEWHIRMQAAFQQHVDNSISKTINLTHDATVADVAHAYRLAWELGCKGITVYRDGSKVGVLHAGTTAAPAAVPAPVAAPESAAPVADGADADLEGVFARPYCLVGRTYSIETPLGTAYITLNEDEDGEPREVIVNQGKAGSDIAPLSEAIGKLLSMVLRVPSTMSGRARIAEVTQRLRGIGGPSSVGFGPNRTRSLPDALAKVLDEYLEATAPPKRSGLLEMLSEAGRTGGYLIPVDPDMDSSVMREKLELLERDFVFSPQMLQSERPSDPYSIPGHSGEICPDCGVALALEEGCRKCHACGFAAC